MLVVFPYTKYGSLTTLRQGNIIPVRIDTELVDHANEMTRWDAGLFEDFRKQRILYELVIRRVISGVVSIPSPPRSTVYRLDSTCPEVQTMDNCSISKHRIQNTSQAQKKVKRMPHTVEKLGPREAKKQIKHAKEREKFHSYVSIPIEG